LQTSADMKGDRILDWHAYMANDDEETKEDRVETDKINLETFHPLNMQ
jgi:hypothetical protein